MSIQSAHWGAPVNPVRLGIIGAGRWGTRIAQSTCRFPDWCCVSKVATREWQELVRHEYVDAVIAACPPELHLPIAEACAAIHKPVWLEKPMALSVEDATRIRALADTVPVFVDHTYLFHPLWPQVLAGMRGYFQACGWRSLRIGSGIDVGPNDFQPHAFSPLWDWHSHSLAAALSLLDPSREWRAWADGAERVEKVEGPVFATESGRAVGYSYTVHMDDGSQIQLWLGRRAPPRVQADHMPRRRALYVMTGDLEATGTRSVLLDFCPERPEATLFGKTLRDPTGLMPLHRALLEFCSTVHWWRCGKAKLDVSHAELGLRVVQVLSKLEPALPNGEVWHVALATGD